MLESCSQLPMLGAILSMLATRFIATAQQGYLDYSFGTNGLAITEIPNASVASGAAALRADGGVVVGGSTSIGQVGVYSIVCYTADGLLDTTFNGTGVGFADFGGNTAQSWGAAVQDDGRILVSGGAGFYGAQDIATARFNVDGSLDSDFGVGGLVSTSIGPGIDAAIDIVSLSDGGILVGGFTQTTGGADVVLLKYFENGALDVSFGTDGIAAFDITGGNDYATDIEVQGDGKVLLCGYSPDSGGYSFVLRSTPEGLLDSTFSSDGVARDTIAIKSSALAVNDDGEIISATLAFVDDHVGFRLTRYHANGALDTAFGSDGSTLTGFGTYGDHPTSMLIDTQGRIVVAGYGYTDFMDRLVMARYLADGELDATFGVDGKLQPDELWAVGFNQTVLLQQDQKIIVAGEQFGDCMAARFFADGQVGVEARAGRAIPRVFPVPFKERVYVDFGEDNLEIVELQLLDGVGKVLSLDQAPIGSRLTGLDLRALPSGSYALRILNRERTRVVKLVKE